MTVVTRFAPSPTGFLHIGGARTALFNWLYARHHGGTFKLRIEDTDKKRSTREAIDAILEGLDWLGLKWDGDVVSQSEGEKRHIEVANKLVEEGKAYKCYCSAEELAEMRAEAEKNKKPFRYDRRWRDKKESDAPENVEPTIRLKVPLEGETIIEDEVQGKVTIQNSEMEDLILLRSDKTPTYMLAVVVDDYDMGVTHIIRGDDHFTNSFKQKIIFEAMGWDVPSFSHIPLIHGPDGAKLSKRHGALGIEAYRDMGYLPEALRNYLLRLGWSHGDDEIISTEQAIEWFNIESIGKSPARIDFNKMANVNGHYMKQADNKRLVNLIEFQLHEITGAKITDAHKELLAKAMDGLKERAKTIKELAENSAFYVKRPKFNEKAIEILDDGGRDIISSLLPELEKQEDWKEESLHDEVKSFSEKNDLKLGNVAQPIRAALSGSNISPSVFEVMALLGKDETIERLKNIK